ncbi:hypothetical protein [Streptomyces griseofuscus]|uniref:hypothetical protein n=1 Tax=Streptomyces griseofuscus TaxID=146922 RepID=UPI003823F718
MTRASHEALSCRPLTASRLGPPDVGHTLGRRFRDRPEDGRRLVSTPPVAPGSPVGTLPGAAVDQRL